MGESLQLLFNISGTKGQDETWLDENFYVDDVMKVAINVALNNSVLVQITKNGGINWVSINSNTPLLGKSEYTFDVHLATGDNFNIRTTDQVGVDIYWFRLIKSTTEE